MKLLTDRQTNGNNTKAG